MWLRKREAEMRRTAITLLAMLAMALMMAMSAATALAGWEYEDCPPYAPAGKANMSPVAFNIVKDIYPPAAGPAWKIPADN